MAMTTSRRGGTIAEINVTPMADVMIVLLIIFMVATPILQMGLDVDVPPKVEITGTPPPNEQNQVVITIKRDGIWVNSSKVADAHELTNTVSKALGGRAPADKVVFINSEDQLPFDASVIAMDAAHEGGAMKIGFLTDPPKD